MNSELEKIDRYFNEIETNRANDPDRITRKSVFEEWELSNRPYPAPVKGPVTDIGGRRAALPKKGDYLLYLSWNNDRSGPDLNAETRQTLFRFPVQLNEGRVDFGDPETLSLSRTLSRDGEAVEVIYDVFDNVRSRKPDADVMKIKKKEFTAILKSLPFEYDPKLLSRMARLKMSEIKTLFVEAAEDMAIDELSSQINLPFDESFAYSSTLESKAIVEKIDSASHTPQRTHWEIIKEIELMLDMTRFKYEVQKNFTLFLSDCDILPMDDPKRSIVRIRDIDTLREAPLYEGSRLIAHRRGDSSKVGRCVIGLLDYDTLFGELIWNDPGDSKNFDEIYLKADRSPHELALKKTKALYDVITRSPDQLKGALRYILGMEPAGLSVDEEPPADTEMDFSQKSAWMSAVNPGNKVVVVQGPPGTGKTWTLAQIIRRLCGQGLRIFITTPSNAALDNVCKMVSDLPTLRFGKAGKIDPEVVNTCWAGSADNIDNYLKKYKPGKTGCIYGATHARGLFDNVITKDYRERGLYDVVVFDEAGMSGMSEFILCSQMGERIIVFGDQRQLPPHPLSEKIQNKLMKKHENTSQRTLSIIGMSAMEWLTRHRNANAVMLKRSYRCQNPRLIRFSSTLFYHAKVKTSRKAEYFQLPYYKRQEVYPASTLRFYSTSSIPENVRREQVVSDENGVGIENYCEAVICRHILIESLQQYSFDQIVVITPYKRQTRLVRKLLDYDTVERFLPESVGKSAWEDYLNSRISTVDSFQGAESDLVIISYVRSNDGQGVGFVDNPNRINVAHTRCRRSIAITGDLECLKYQAKSDIFNRMERAFIRDGEIIDITESLFDTYVGTYDAAG